MDIDILKGKTLVSIIGDIGGKEIIFQTDSGEKYQMAHIQD